MVGEGCLEKEREAKFACAYEQMVITCWCVSWRIEMGVL